MSRYAELPIPAAIYSDANAMELARVWVGGGKQHVSLATGVWNDPSSWGIMLADLARHVANAYQHTRGADATDVLRRIKSAFDAEWEAATDSPQGGLVE